MTRWVLGLALAVMTALWTTMALADCADRAGPCRVAKGTYHLLLPKAATGPVPAVMLLHGYGGEGAGMIGNSGLVNVILGRGYAVIAPDGQSRPTGRGRTWDFHPDRPSTRDEAAFLSAVADHAAATYGVHRPGILLAGFSIGGSMTTYVACQTPAAFAAYAPIAGSFWRPHPAACAGPVRLLHTHGTGDRTVPLTGREIMPGLVQGNVIEAMDLLRQTNRCASDPAAPALRDGPFTTQVWPGCTPGSDLRFVLHAGGHSIPKGWALMALDWFEAGGALTPAQGVP